MCQVVIFDPTDPVVPNRALEYIQSANTADYLDDVNVLINPDLSALTGVFVKHWKRSGDLVVEMSFAEKAALESAEAAAQVAAIRAAAKGQLDGFGDIPLFQRAFADIAKDEINLLRKWTRDFKAEVAAATNLADLKTRVSGLPTLNDRTLDQLKTAIKNRVDDGGVDQ